jgi:hypothetical protein
MQKYFLIQRFNKTLGWQTVWDWETAGFFTSLVEAAEKFKYLKTVHFEPHRIKMIVRQ